MNYLKDEPLAGHAVYEKIVALSKGPGRVFKQVARHRETGELVAIKVGDAMQNSASLPCDPASFLRSSFPEDGTCRPQWRRPGLSTTTWCVHSRAHGPLHA